MPFLLEFLMNKTSETICISSQKYCLLTCFEIYETIMLSKVFKYIFIILELSIIYALKGHVNES